MSEPYLSQVEAFAFNYAPVGWMQCQGQTLSVNQNQALFSLLGTTFGGNGTTTFQLPDLRSRLPVGMGQGPNLSNYPQGTKTGSETVTLTTANMPSAHTHTVGANNATSGNTNTPTSSTVLSSGYTSAPAGNTAVNIYSTAAPTVTMGAMAPVGGQPHSNIMPVQPINYCICVQGLFPSRG